MNDRVDDLCSEYTEPLDTCSRAYVTILVEIRCAIMQPYETRQIAGCNSARIHAVELHQVAV